MKKYFKKHIALIILLVLAFSFPTSLSNQARLNMRIIVTGLAIDKKEDEFEVTAQIVKTSPGNESGGISAEVNFLTDKDKTLLGAISKLSYKAGKVSVFSHTNFIIVGEELAKTENLKSSLNYFLRDRIIKNTALILFSNGSASDEIKKTKNIELSVGLGLQKVYLFKERECDGIMLTVLDFLNQSVSFSKTTTASMIELDSNEQENGESSGGEKTGSSGSSKTNSGRAGGEGGDAESYQYFKPIAPLVCFVDGVFKGKIEDQNQILGFMLANKNSKAEDFSLENVSGGKMENLTVGVKMENKNIYKKIRYENNIPYLEICVTVEKSEIEEIQTKGLVTGLENEEYQAIALALEKDIKTKISACFEKSKELDADMLGAYELAYKHKHKQLTKNSSSPEEFLKALQLDVKVKIKSLEY